MAENRTKATDASVADCLATIEDESRRRDCEALAKLMRKVTGHRPMMWVAGIVSSGRLKETA